MGSPRKPAERRVRRNVDAVHAVVIPLPRPPAAPKGLGIGGRAEWKVFWASPLAGIVCETDLPALRRLFRLREEARAAHAAYATEPVVLGASEQPVINPLGRHALAIDAAAQDLEDRFGLNPKARLGMGVRMGQVADAAERHPGLLGTDRADPRRPAPPVVG